MNTQFLAKTHPQQAILIIHSVFYPMLQIKVKVRVRAVCVRLLPAFVLSWTADILVRPAVRRCRGRPPPPVVVEVRVLILRGVVFFLLLWQPFWRNNCACDKQQDLQLCRIMSIFISRRGIKKGKNAPSNVRSRSAPHATTWCWISPLRYTMIIGTRLSGRFGMHLSPTMLTNLVRGWRAASVRICVNARSDAGCPSLYRKHTTPVPRPFPFAFPFSSPFRSSSSSWSSSSSSTGALTPGSSTALASVTSRV